MMSNTAKHEAIRVKLQAWSDKRGLTHKYKATYERIPPASGTGMVVYKRTSTHWLMWLFALCMPLMGGMSREDFITRYVTHVGSTIYWPAEHKMTTMRFILTTSHEAVHHEDQQELGVLRYVLLYSDPQLASILLLLIGVAASVACWWYLPLIVFLPFVFAPVAMWGGESEGRTWVEMRGYATTMAVNIWLGEKLMAPPEHIIDQFTGPAYLHMCRDRDKVREELQGWIDKAWTNQILEDIPVLRELQEIINPDFIAFDEGTYKALKTKGEL